MSSVTRSCWQSAFASIILLLPSIVLAACGQYPTPNLPTPSTREPTSAAPSPVVSPEATGTAVGPSPTVHVEPASGAFRLTTTPPVAPVEWSFRFRSQDGRESREPDVVPRGTTALIGQNQLPGVFQAILNGIVCRGTFEIIGGRQTLVRVDVSRSGDCNVVVMGSNDLPN